MSINLYEWFSVFEYLSRTQDLEVEGLAGDKSVQDELFQEEDLRLRTQEGATEEDI